MNFRIFLCVTLKLFSLSFVPPLAPNPGDDAASQWTEFHQTLVDDVVRASDELIRF